ncbi:MULTISPECIES: extracellular solute-binding protein [unclassified Streptomyces]|uniref:ABC transporter substrate-binding protein n=1 Tax=unclassified Streptomyces TaxID=2593676 RepID=UPI00166103E7|nr:MULTISPECIES: extracellular solute-binding protein [unclassified Streptomyces]MBD0707866.1 sugar-binding protein [Streptomyces sp. CBMA291]MBD0717567.1 sugar-binding protein [Streptomyces sp. CBMA370]
MRSGWRRAGAYRGGLALVLFLLVALLAAGCATDPAEPSPVPAHRPGGHPAGRRPVTLTVGVFGTFGLREAGLYEEYERLHPGIAVRQTSLTRNDVYYPQLLTHLAAGSGLADVQAVEVGNIAEVVTTQAGRLVELGTLPGVDRRAFLPWKWAQGTGPDGRVLALGTDIGPGAVCYRKDLFARAGLPTGRDAVGRLWAGDWRKYRAAGLRYRERAPAGTAFTDSASGVLAAVVASAPLRYYDTRGALVVAANPAVREAWDLAASFARQGLTARLQQFTPDWDQAFAHGAFATVACPAWMLGYIQDKTGPAGRGRWDVATAPRPGNWGGSFLVVPAEGRHPAEAARLAAWLTAPAQQARLFARRGSFPSASAAYPLPEVAAARAPYFGDAPVGTLYAEAARGVPQAPVGPKDALIAQTLADTGMLQIDQTSRDPADAWHATLKTLDNALDR